MLSVNVLRISSCLFFFLFCSPKTSLKLIRYKKKANEQRDFALVYWTTIWSSCCCCYYIYSVVHAPHIRYIVRMVWLFFFSLYIDKRVHTHSTFGYRIIVITMGKLKITHWQRVQCSPFAYTILLLLNRQLHLLLWWNCPSIRATIGITLSTNIFTRESNSSHEHSIRLNSHLANISINILSRIL